MTHTEQLRESPTRKPDFIIDAHENHSVHTTRMSFV